MFYKSIRFKITVLYMAVLALTLSSFSLVLYHNVKRGLSGGMDTLLKSKAGGDTQAIDTYWEASKFELTENGVTLDPAVWRKRRNVNFATTAQRWVKEESNDPKLIDIIVHVFDTDGAIIASSTNVPKLTEISRKNFLSVLQGKSRFDTVTSGEPSARMTLRIYTTPVFENEKVAYIAQVASPLVSIETALNNLKVALFILFPITVLATGIVGAFLAKVTLRPVDNMIETIHQIRAENMKLRIKVSPTRDEIQKLAETFNDMLGRLERAFTSQRQLFEDLSHELKTPLTILRGEFETILKKIRSHEEYEAILKSGLEEINKITGLAENLLLLARFDAKAVFPERKILDLNLLMQGVINSVKRLAESKEIAISFNCEEERLLIDGEEDHLKTIFLNIIDNGIKYTPQKGSVEVTSGREGSLAKVSVHDTGIGIPKDEIAHIFDRFYQVDKSRHRGGFGLGLSIAKSVVEAHNGTIEAESQSSEGATFTVRLPLAQSM